MSIPVEKKVKVIKAKYVENADSILILGECDEGQLKHQINSSCFYFGNKNKKVEMEKLAELMIGKTIKMVFDPDLDQKIKDHVSLKY